MESNRTATRLHYSDRTGCWMPCIAENNCWYGEHSSPLELAIAGGAEAGIHKRPHSVSPLFMGGYSVKPAEGTRTETFRADGTQMTPTEARAWRQRKEAQKMIDEIEAAGKAKHDATAPNLSQREKAKLWAAQHAAERQSRMIFASAPEPYEPEKQKGTSAVSGYEAYLAAKEPAEAPVEPQPQPVLPAPEVEAVTESPALSGEAQEILAFFAKRTPSNRDSESLRNLANGQRLSKARLYDLQMAMSREGVYPGSGAEPTAPAEPKRDWKADSATTSQINFLAKLKGISQIESQHLYGKETKGAVSREISRMKAILDGDS